MPPRVLKPFSLDRVERAIEKVRERLLRAAAALDRAGIDYAIAGGHAVALWVSRIDEAAVRNTRDVDVLIRRDDFERVKTALGAAGFVHRHVSSIDAFLDGPDGRFREAVHLIYANEVVRPGEPFANPGVDQAEAAQGYRVLDLDALVRIKLTSFRDKDRTHLRDMIEVGLIGQDTAKGLPDPLRERLQGLLDDPLG